MDGLTTISNYYLYEDQSDLQSGEHFGLLNFSVLHNL